MTSKKNTILYGLSKIDHAYGRSDIDMGVSENFGETPKVDGNIDIYPLVNLQKTMDNHHFQWVNPLFLWAIFNSYFDITRGYGFAHHLFVGLEKPPTRSFGKSCRSSFFFLRANDEGDPSLVYGRYNKLDNNG